MVLLTELFLNISCFGLACAPAIFDCVSFAIARMLDRRRFCIVVYLDDILIISFTKTGNRTNKIFWCLLLNSFLTSTKKKLLCPTKQSKFWNIHWTAFTKWCFFLRTSYPPVRPWPEIIHNGLSYPRVNHKLFWAICVLQHGGFWDTHFLRNLRRRFTSFELSFW